MIPKQPVENVCLFLSSSAPIPNRCLSSYLPITSTTYFPDDRTTWSSCSPSPRDRLSSGSTESSVSSPGFPMEKKKGRPQVALRDNIPSLQYCLLSDTSKYPSLHLFSLPYLSLADPVACSVSPEVLKHIIHKCQQQRKQFTKTFSIHIIMWSQYNSHTGVINHTLK